jgi:SAM-dependent methyltransferase
MAAFARMMVGLVGPVGDVLEAFRTGEGVPYSAYPEDFLHGQGAMNRVQFVNFLGTEWLPSIPDVHERLLDGGRVADVACGTGWSSISIARAYPRATVVGIDNDEASITAARETVAREGLADRIDFELADAAALDAGDYDLVLVIEALHDLSQPVAALEAMRRLAGGDGAVLVVDERVADSFTAPGDEVERMMYGWSILHCLPTAMVDPQSAATGTAMRIGTLRDYAARAGFGDVEVLPIENDFWRFYRLHA